MEWNKLRRLFLNYFLISWHLFAFMIIFSFDEVFRPFACHLKRRKNQSLRKQTEARNGSGGQTKGWRMMNQFTNLSCSGIGEILSTEISSASSSRSSILDSPGWMKERMNGWMNAGTETGEIYYAAEHLIIYYRIRSVMVGNRWCKSDFQWLIGGERKTI